MEKKSKTILKILISVCLCFLFVVIPQNSQLVDAKLKTTKKSSTSSKLLKSSKKSSNSSNSSNNTIGKTSYSNKTYLFYFSPNTTRSSGYLRHKHKSYRIYLDVQRDSTESTNNTDFKISTDDPDIGIRSAQIFVSGKYVGDFSKTSDSTLELNNFTVANGSKVQIKVKFESYYWLFGRFSKTVTCTFDVSIKKA